MFSIQRPRKIDSLLWVVMVQAIIISAWGATTTAAPPGEANVTTATSTNQSVTLDGEISKTESGEKSEKVDNLAAAEEMGQVDDSPSKTGLMVPPRGEISGIEASSSRQFRTSELAEVPWYRSGIGALLIVLTVIGGGYFAIRKWVPTMRAVDGNIIKVLSRTSLSPKHQAVLVKVGKRMLLVGMTAENMTTLTELTDDDELGEVLASSSTAKREHRAQFETMLGQQQERFVDDDEADDESSQSTQGRRREPLSKLLRRLRQLQSSP